MTFSTRQLVEWDRRYLWHPFTQMRDWLAEEPLTITHGDGNYLSPPTARATSTASRRCGATSTAIATPTSTAR
jgi:adenosylmethionine-8-amino-7-oxononanoate aminotransferase